MTTEVTELLDPNSHADLIEMAEEIGKAVALGLAPIVGQAINVYDTVESLLTLHRSESAFDRAEAKFDLVLALVGWIPGAGGGVKKSIRIVNKHPDRYAPILFDVLRLVLAKLGIETSPEVLLNKLFDAAGLKSMLGTVQSAIEQSWLFEKMPSEGQLALKSSMTTVSLQLPAMVAAVLLKLAYWATKQRNNAARPAHAMKKNPADQKPAKKDKKVGTSGESNATKAQGNGTTNAQIGTAVLDELSRNLTGIMGEHITDYFLREEWNWGESWTKHDQGNAGVWATIPSRTVHGKLNDRTTLNELFALKAHGPGIDGVWKVKTTDPHNKRKKYAIVESKASANARVPKDPTKKANISRKLGHNARTLAQALDPKLDDMLEPETYDEAAPGAPKKATRRSGKMTAPGKVTQPKKASAKKTDGSVGEAEAGSGKVIDPIIQMSHIWIRKNITIAVKDAPAVALEIIDKGSRVYSRHLFFTPLFLATTTQHSEARLKGNVAGVEAMHRNHHIPVHNIFDENEVKAAVNHKSKKLNIRLED